MATLDVRLIDYLRRASDAVKRYGGHDADCSQIPGLDACCLCGWDDVLIEAERCFREPDDETIGEMIAKAERDEDDP